VGIFLKRAEEILDVAVSTSIGGSSDFAILIRHDGGMQIFDGIGWELTGLMAEYGAREVYKIERRLTLIRVAGQSGSQTCLLERKFEPSRGYPPARHSMGYPIRSQAAPLAIAGSNEWSPQVLNS